jgi:hypothetical protein
MPGIPAQKTPKYLIGTTLRESFARPRRPGKTPLQIFLSPSCSWPRMPEIGLEKKVQKAVDTPFAFVPKLASHTET